MDDKEYDNWDEQVGNAEKENDDLIEGFSKYLTGKALDTKTIQKHIDNVDFYVNTFLLRYEIIPAEKGSYEIGDFLGDFFIRKAMWSTKAAVEQNIVSFKKFYTYLNEIGKLSDEDLFEMKLMIKEETETWIERVVKYNSNTDGDWY
jgi:hypothetical protein